MKRLVSAIAAMLLSAATAQAEPPLCKGQDLLAALKDRNPEAHAEVMAEAAKVKNGKNLLWKIEKEGAKPSWLFGTAHVTDPRITKLPPMARQALEKAEIVALELKEIRSREEMALASMRQSELMVLQPGKSLWDLIPDADEPMIRDNPNMPPGTVGTIFGYQPWVVAAMLSIPACEFARNQAGIASLDEALAVQAGKQGAELIGLETVREQLGVFSSMPLDLQVKYLLSVARLGTKLQDYFETMIRLYDRRQIGAYVPLALKLEPDTAENRAMMVFVERDVTIKRNYRMAERAAEVLARGNAFIAVGALHLPGDEGLVELLRKAGYKLTPAN